MIGVPLVVVGMTTIAVNTAATTTATTVMTKKTANGGTYGKRYATTVT